MYQVGEILANLNISYEHLCKIANTRVISFGLEYKACCDYGLVLPVNYFSDFLGKINKTKPGALILLQDSDFNREEIVEVVKKLEIDTYLLAEYIETQKLVSLLEEENELKRLKSLVSREYSTLVSFLSKGYDIKEFERYAYKLLRNPMIITDKSYKVLAYSEECEVMDPVWESIIANTYSTFSLVEKTNINNFWERLEQAESPLFVDEEAFQGMMKRAVAKICVAGRTKGYIALLESEKSITELDLSILQMVAEVLSVKFGERERILRATGQLTNEFVKDILTGSFTDIKMIEDRSSSLGITFQKYHCVLMVKNLNETTDIKTTLKELYNPINYYTNLCLYTLKGKTIYFILSFRNFSQWLRFKEIVSFLLKEKNRIGVLSSLTESILSIQHCYTEIESIRQLLPYVMDTNTYLYTYTSLAVLAIICKMRNLKDVTFRSKAYKKLISHDLREGTEYIETLRQYFDCNQNVSQTADKLFLHRNTVNYRLNKIRDLLEDDFDDSLVRLHLHLNILADDLY